MHTTKTESNEAKLTSAFYAQMYSALEERYENNQITTLQFRAECREIELAETAALRNLAR